MKWHAYSVDFASEVGTLYGEVILPEAEGPFPAAVLCHGLGTDHRAMRPSAQRLARQGIATLTFDFRGHGRSDGAIDGDEAEDVLAAIGFLRSYPKIDLRRIALVGHSLGALASIRAAGQLKNLHALVSISCPSEINGRLQGSFSSLYHKAAQMGNFILEFPRIGPPPGLGRIRGVLSMLWMRIRGYRFRLHLEKSVELWSRFKPTMVLEKMGDFPKLFVHCEGDRLAHYKGAFELYEKATLPKELFVSKGGFHSTPLFPGRVRRRWISWLASSLAPEKEGLENEVRNPPRCGNQP
jgi:pimeloyl-ACP methyl ester carboxylesterase